MWEDVRYEKGVIEVVAYDNEGKEAGRKCVHTAGKPHHIEVVSGLEFTGCSCIPAMKADGKDLCYLTVKVVDKDGNLCPDADNLLNFSVSGSASYKASANGDPTCLDLFHLPQMHAFKGMLTVILQAGESAGPATLKISAKGLKGATVNLSVE